MIDYTPFKSLSSGETAELRRCLCTISKTYEKGEEIMSFSEKKNKAGIIDYGKAHLIRIDPEGRKSIIEYYESGDIFGKMFSPDSELSSYSLTAKEKCGVSFINSEKLTTKCEDNCLKHSIFINNLFACAMFKSHLHIDVLSQRTIRLKLIAFFENLKRQQKSDRIILPLSFSDLADYLAVDRSAMMREIKSLKENEIISVKGKAVRLLRSDSEY